MRVVSNDKDELDEFENTFGLWSKRISSATKKWGPDTNIISKGVLAITYEDIFILYYYLSGCTCLD